jgi:hypothetical protein
MALVSPVIRRVLGSEQVADIVLWLQSSDRDRRTRDDNGARLATAR